MTVLPIHIPNDQIAAFCRRFGIEEFSLFGSVLRDDFGPDSDIDVMVKFLPGHGFTFENIPDIQDELERLFNRPVDVIRKGAGAESYSPAGDYEQLPGGVCRITFLIRSEMGHCYWIC